MIGVPPEPPPLRLKRLPPRPEGPQHRPPNRTHVGPPVAVQVRLHVARPGDLQLAECPQVQGLVVDAPHASIQADDQLHLGWPSCRPLSRSARCVTSFWSSPAKALLGQFDGTLAPFTDPGLFRFEDTGLQCDEIVRRLDRRVGDFHVEHSIERGVGGKGWTRAGRMEARGQANPAPLTRCSSLPLGWLVVGQLGEGLALAPTNQPIPSESQAAPAGSSASQKGSKKSSKRGAPKKLSVFAKRSLSGFAPGTATYL